MLGAIFFKAQNKIQDPAKLSRLVQLIDAESWISLGADTNANANDKLNRHHECLLRTPKLPLSSIVPAVAMGRKQTLGGHSHTLLTSLPSCSAS